MNHICIRYHNQAIVVEQTRGTWRPLPGAVWPTKSWRSGMTPLRIWRKPWNWIPICAPRPVAKSFCVVLNRAQAAWFICDDIERVLVWPGPNARCCVGVLKNCTARARHELFGLDIGRFRYIVICLRWFIRLPIYAMLYGLWENKAARNTEMYGEQRSEATSWIKVRRSHI